MMTKDRTEIAQTVNTASRARRPMYVSMPEPSSPAGSPPHGDGEPGASGAYFFQKNVTGREIVGVLPSGLLYWRDGMFPMFVLTTRTPMEAGPMPITPMM